MTRRREELCEVMLAPHDVIDDTGPWEATVDYKKIAGPFQTPGQALDAAVRWAQQRGLQLAVSCTTYPAYRVIDDEPLPRPA